MNILLVNPINRSYVVMPSLGLGYLAAVARRAGHTVTVLNCIKEKTTYESFGSFIAGGSFDIMGFQVFSYDLNSVRRHLDIVKQVRPAVITVAGGPHPSGDPKGIMKYLPQLDFAFQGEAEIGFPVFLEKLTLNDSDFSAVPGLVYRDGDDIRKNPPKHASDLDALPMPAWEILEPETYPEAPHGAFTRRFPTAPIMITRGCPGRCTFCSGKNITGNILRKRSLNNVMAELNILHSRGIREFHIEDENFTVHRKLVMEFCSRLKQEGLDMSWSLPSGVRIDCLDRELLETMEQAGCYSLALGIEFGTQRIMDLTQKKLSLELIRQKLTLFKGLNIKITGFFLFNIPGETLEEMKETVAFSLELPIDRAQYNIFMPLPGSALWDQLHKEGRLGDINWDKFFVHDVAYIGETVSAETIKRLQRNAYLRFYLRPRIIRGILSEIRSLKHLKFLLKRFLDALS
jgi:anaerobic magnesium-protoporphyrin IX monomethyl ester cyclase